MVVRGLRIELIVRELTQASAEYLEYINLNLNSENFIIEKEEFSRIFF